MGLMNLYQLYDKKAQCVQGPVMPEKRDGPALRNFHALLADQRTTPGQYPEDFSLLYLGFQDENTGQIESTTPQTVADGLEWANLRRQEADDRQRAERAASPDLGSRPENSTTH